MYPKWIDRGVHNLKRTVLAERYERRSVVITSNLVFSQWDQIFKDPVTTTAAIDHVVHHSIIVEFRKVMSSCGRLSKIGVLNKRTVGSRARRPLKSCLPFPATEILGKIYS